VTAQHLILIAIALWVVVGIAASAIVFSALYLGDDDRYGVQPGDIADADDD